MLQDPGYAVDLLTICPLEADSEKEGLLQTFVDRAVANLSTELGVPLPTEHIRLRPHPERPREPTYVSPMASPPRPGERPSVAVRSILDTLWIQSCQQAFDANRGIALDELPEGWFDLKRLWHSGDESVDFLGLCERCWIEYEPNPQVGHESLAKQALDALRTRVNAPLGDRHEFELDGGRLAVIVPRVAEGRPDDRVWMALAYEKGTDRTRELQFELPWLAVSILKQLRVEFQIQELELAAHSQTEKLTAELKNSRANHTEQPNLLALEQNLEKLSSQREELGEVIARLLAGRRTAMTARTTLETTLRSPFFAPVRAEITLALSEPLMLRILKKVETAEDYARIVLSRVEGRLQRWELEADLLTTRQERRITVVLFALSCLQALSLLKDFMDFPATTAPTDTYWRFSSWPEWMRLGLLLVVVIVFGIWGYRLRKRGWM